MTERHKGVESHSHSNHEIEKAAAERIRSLEKTSEHLPNRKESIESARERLRHAEHKASHHEAAPKAEPVTRRPLLTKAENYRQTMVSLRHRLKPANRSFSKIIHNPVVENVSE